jgi:hypothetical protein
MNQQPRAKAESRPTALISQASKPLAEAKTLVDINSVRDKADVIAAFEILRNQAAGAGGQVIVTMGNHAPEFVARLPAWATWGIVFQTDDLIINRHALTIEACLC